MKTMGVLSAKQNSTFPGTLSIAAFAGISPRRDMPSAMIGVAGAPSSALSGVSPMQALLVRN